jgi:hypothetical protein
MEVEFVGAIHELPLLCLVIPEGLIGDPYLLSFSGFPVSSTGRALPEFIPQKCGTGMTQKLTNCSHPHLYRYGVPADLKNS